MSSAWFERRYVRRQGLTRHKLSFRPVTWQGWLFLVGGIAAIIGISALAPLAQSQLGIPRIIWSAVSIPLGLVIVFRLAWIKSRPVRIGDDAS